MELIPKIVTSTIGLINQLKEALFLKTFTAGPNDQGMRLSRFVKRVTRALPDTLMYKSFRNRRIKVNGKRAAPDVILNSGDIVELYINDEFFPDTGGGWPLSAGPLPSFGIVYEDKDIAILYKPEGVLSHPDAKATPTLLDAFIQHLLERGEYAPDVENTFVPALCNRLDWGTEGLVLAAKNAAALREMNAIIREGLLHKTYLCVCVHKPPTGIYYAHLLRDRDAKKVSVTEQAVPGSKPITTEIYVREQKCGLSLCEVKLHTGRTHQIRAHLAFLNSPLLGDAKYGNVTTNTRYSQSTQLLCAIKICFDNTLPDGPLSHLTGQCFEASQAKLPLWWNQMNC